MADVKIPLDLPDVEVLKVEIKGKTIIINVESTLKSALCKRCGREITRFAGYSESVQVRHLPSFGCEVFIRYRPKRYECPYCDGQPKTTQALTWHTAKSPYTRAYEEHILTALINSTVEDVSRKEGLGYGGVEGILERGVASQVEWARYGWLGVLGIDEIALKKGYRDFVVIVSAHLANGQVVVLGVLPDRQAKTLEGYLRSIPPALQTTIHSVCVDMYETYRQVVHTVLPQAQVVVDRFHVTQKYREAADRVRKDEMKRLKQSLPKAEYATLKACRRAFWKNRGTLDSTERQALERLFTYAPKLYLIHAFRESLRAVFERPLSKTQAQAEINTWVFLVREQHLTCFEPFLKTLAHFFDEITNFFVHRFTSGFVEGLNNKIKVLKRRAFGVFNLAHFFQRLFLDLEGYQVFA
jgi:transposase